MLSMTNYYTYLSNSIYSAILIYLYILTLCQNLKGTPTLHEQRENNCIFINKDWRINWRYQMKLYCKVLVK